MRKKFDYRFDKGLPGGANQVKGRVKGSVTQTGYKRNSPDVNNDFNIIPSPYITMVGVDFPVYGEDNLGNGQMMYPGNEYMFPGDYVTELPAYGDGGLKQWFAEKWVDIKTGKKCGRSGKDKNGRPYPACRPSRRVNKSTPKTVGELSSAEKAKFKREKTSGKRINYNHTAQFGGRSGDLFQEVDTYIKPGQNIRPNWAQTPASVTNYTFGKNLVDDESRFSLGVQGTDILDEIKYRADAIGSVGIGVGNRKGKSFRPAGENLRAGVRGQASWQGVPGNVIENMFGRRSGLDWRGSFEGEAGLAYANGAVRPYMSVMPQTNVFLNDNLSLGIGYEMRGRYDKNFDQPVYGNTDTGSIAPVSQRDAYSGMGRGAARFSLNYDLGNGDFIEGYYAKPDPLYQGSMPGIREMLAIESEQPRFGVRLRKSFKNGGFHKYQGGGLQGPPYMTEGPLQQLVYPSEMGPPDGKRTLEENIRLSNLPKSTSRPVRKSTSNQVDTDRLRRGIKYAESINGKLMMNPESTATGFYGQLFSEIEGKQFLKDIDRKTFAADTNLQNRVFDERLKGNKELFGIGKGLVDNGIEIYNEYKPILKDKLKYTPTELAALSNMLGRQGTREYLGYVLRDGKSLGEALPNIYGPNAKYKNKTPEEYIKKFNEAFKNESVVNEPVSINQSIYNFKEGGEKDKTPPSIDPSLLNPALTARLPQIGPQAAIQIAEPAIPAFTQEDEVRLRQTLLDSTNPSETSAYSPTIYQGPSDYISSEQFDVSEKLANTSYVAPDVTQRYVDNVNGQIGYDLQDLNRKYYKKYTSSNKPDVLEIQQDLINKGFLDDSELDGMYGPKTQKAVKAYNNSLNALNINSDLIPAKIDDTRCAAGMCSVLEEQGVNTRSLGLKYKNAWDILESSNKSGNATTVYNIYDEPEFSNVKSASDIKNATRSVKRRSQTTADMYEVGDIVGIYWPNSSHHSETIGSKTNNTHVGFVSGIDENGQPIISHNVGGNIKQDRWDNLVTGWISRPNNVSQVRVKYDAENWKDVEVPESVISNFESKIERPLTDQEASNVTNVIKRVSYNAQTLPEKLGSSVDPQWLKESVTGILGNETALGLNVKRTREEIAEADRIRGIAYTVKGVEDEDISLGMGKVKYSSLDPFSKQFFDITSPEDLGDDNKNIDVTTYNMIKHYDMFKDYSSQFPELGLTEDDIRNMSILSHNQGTSKLLKLGRNADFQTVEQEVRKLRELYDSESDDISSTNYRYVRSFGNLFGDTGADIADSLGRGLYNLENTIKGKTPGYESYISKANRYGDWLYNKDDSTKYPTLYDFMKAKGVSPNYQNRERIYKQFFKEDYSGTVSQNNKLLQFLSAMNPQGPEFASIMGLG